MKKIILMFMLVLLTISLCACGNTQKHYDNMMNEWVSPDGVHYWAYKGEGNHDFLAPRYDNDGKLVIDRAAKVIVDENGTQVCSKCGWAVNYVNYCSRCGAKFE